MTNAVPNENNNKENNMKNFGATLIIEISPDQPDAEFSPARVFRTSIPFSALCPNSLLEDEGSVEKAMMHLELAAESIIEKMTAYGIKDDASITVELLPPIDERFRSATATVVLSVREAGLAADLVSLLVPNLATPKLQTRCLCADESGQFHEDPGYSTRGSDAISSEIELDISICSYDGAHAAVWSIPKFVLSKDLESLPPWTYENKWSLGKTIHRALLPFAGNQGHLISFRVLARRIQINVVLPEGTSRENYNALLKHFGLMFPGLSRRISVVPNNNTIESASIFSLLPEASLAPDNS